MPYFVTVIDESAIRGYSNIAMEFPELGVHCAEPSCSRLGDLNSCLGSALYWCFCSQIFFLSLVMLVTEFSGKM